MSRLFDLVFSLSLLFLSAEILVRRWVWDQIPSQIGRGFVYALLIVNAFYLYRYGKRLLRMKITSK